MGTGSDYRECCTRHPAVFRHSLYLFSRGTPKVARCFSVGDLDDYVRNYASLRHAERRCGVFSGRHG